MSPENRKILRTATLIANITMIVGAAGALWLMYEVLRVLGVL